VDIEVPNHNVVKERMFPGVVEVAEDDPGVELS
jgi:hypothetical protein